MKNERDNRIIQKMIGYCDDIEHLMNYFGCDIDIYKTNIAFQYSCNMCIIQIGELVNRVSDEVIYTHDEIPWHAIRGMRNLHAHDYDNVDLEIVWNTLVEDIHVLKKQLLELLLGDKMLADVVMRNLFATMNNISMYT